MFIVVRYVFFVTSAPRRVLSEGCRRAVGGLLKWMFYITLAAFIQYTLTHWLIGTKG